MSAIISSAVICRISQRSILLPISCKEFYIPCEHPCNSISSPL